MLENKKCADFWCVCQDSHMFPLKFPLPSLAPASGLDNFDSLFFTAFESDDEVLPSDRRQPQSVMIDYGGPTTFSAFGNKLKLSTTGRGGVTLTLAKRVCNVQQIEARKGLVEGIARARKAIKQDLEQLMKFRHGPSSLAQYAEQEKKLLAHHQSLVTDCTFLKKMWPLEPETGTEYHSWTLHKDDEGVTVIFLPDLRPGQEGRYIETRFWFGSASVLQTINMPAADVSMVPDCIEPYRPFNVPEVWREEWREMNMCMRTLV